jgi:DNA-binding MarR family transcriptional regulator
MSSVNGIPDHVPPHIAALLDRARRRYRAELADIGETWLAGLVSAELRAAGAALRGSHFRLLAHVPPGGARVTDIAEMADITKQATGEQLAVLAKWKLVETVPQASDRRIRLTRRTPLGDEMAAEVNAMVTEVEERWSKVIGESEFETLRQALIAIINS